MQQKYLTLLKTLKKYHSVDYAPGTLLAGLRIMILLQKQLYGLLKFCLNNEHAANGMENECVFDTSETFNVYLSGTLIEQVTNTLM